MLKGNYGVHIGGLLAWLLTSINNKDSHFRIHINKYRASKGKLDPH